MPQTLTEENSIDRSISYLLIGLAVVGFMVLTVAGMSSIQKSAENVRASQPSADSAPVEIHDFGE